MRLGRSQHQRRQVIAELQHRLRYASQQERGQILQELNFWQHYSELK